MTLYESCWEQWLKGEPVDLSGLTNEEQLKFHEDAIRILQERSPRFATVPLSLIVKPDRPLDRETVDRLKEAIMKGPITPIIVKKNGDGTFRLVDGFHKLVALQELGNTEGPVEFKQ